MKPTLSPEDAPVLLPAVVPDDEPVMLCSLLLGLSDGVKEPDVPRPPPLDFTGSRWFAANEAVAPEAPPPVLPESSASKPDA